MVCSTGNRKPLKLIISLLVVYVGVLHSSVVASGSNSITVVVTKLRHRSQLDHSLAQEPLTTYFASGA